MDQYHCSAEHCLNDKSDVEQVPSSTVDMMIRDPLLACFVPWDRIGASRTPFSLDASPYGHTLKAPARPGLSFTLCVSAATSLGGRAVSFLLDVFVIFFGGNERL
jgi:hypothetical protein